MIAIVHLLVVLVMCKLLKLDRTESMAALLFGVLIDLDHIFAYADFIGMQGLSGALDYQAAMATDLEWKSILHSPMAAVVVIPASMGFRMAIPALAWGLHLAMDWVQIEYLGVLSPAEMALLVILTIALVHLEKRDLDRAGHETTHLWAVRSLFQRGCGELARPFRLLRGSRVSQDTPS